ALADDARDAVDELHDLDVPFEQGEERLTVALVRRVLARGEGDVPSGAGEPLPALGAESGEVGDPLDLFGRDHVDQTLLRLAHDAEPGADEASGPVAVFQAQLEPTRSSGAPAPSVAGAIVTSTSSSSPASANWPAKSPPPTIQTFRAPAARTICSWTGPTLPLTSSI